MMPSLRLLSVVLAGLVLALAGCEEKEHARTTLSIPMTQGGELAADLYLPPGPGPWPTILLQTPYGKSLWDAERLPLDSDPNYAYVIVDNRGRGDSSAAQNPDAEPGVDGYDVVEWIAQQSWSDGHVGGWGPSALGIIQLQTAREAPPHLDAIVPLVAGIWDHYERYYQGGVMREEYVQMLGSLGFANVIFVKAYPSRKPLIAEQFWLDRESLTDYGDEIDVPALMIGGWNDFATPRLLRVYGQMPGDEKRLLMGPWTHGDVDSGESGELLYPGAQHYATHAARFFLDHHLRGVGPGLPGGPVWWHDGGTDAWSEDTTWPPSGARAPQDLTLYLQADGGLSETPAGGSDGSSTYVYDPEDPSPTVGGPEHAPFGEDSDHGPRDQAPLVESRSDVEIFTTEALATDLTMVGTSKAILHVSSDRTDTDFMVRVTDVHPDGRSMLVVDGARRARFRDTYSTEDDLITPGEVYELEIDLLDVATTFKAGHRIRVIVSSSNYPRFELNPNTGGPLSGAGSSGQEPLVATNTVYHSSSYASRLELSVLPTAARRSAFSRR